MSDKLYSLEQLQSLAGDSQEFVDSMIETFLEHTPGQLEEMLDAYQKEDLKSMGNIAHKIKPNIDLLEIESIRDEIRSVESKGKSGVNDADLKGTVEKVKETLEATFDQLRRK